MQIPVFLEEMFGKIKPIFAMLLKPYRKKLWVFMLAHFADYYVQMVAIFSKRYKTKEVGSFTQKIINEADIIKEVFEAEVTAYTFKEADKKIQNLVNCLTFKEKELLMPFLNLRVQMLSNFNIDCMVSRNVEEG